MKNYLIKREIIYSYDNDYLADAKFIINTIEDVHPYFIGFYDCQEYKEVRYNFFEKCQNVSLVNFECTNNIIYLNVGIQ